MERPNYFRHVPIGECLQSLAHLVVPENVECLEIRLYLLEYGHKLTTETALRIGRVTLHEDHERMLVNDRLEPIIQFHLLRHRRLQFSVFVHLFEDVDSTNEIAVDVELRVSGPI